MGWSELGQPFKKIDLIVLFVTRTRLESQRDILMMDRQGGYLIVLLVTRTRARKSSPIFTVEGLSMQSMRT